MTLTDAAIADAAHHAAVSRLRTYARAPGVQVRRGAGWFAVRTGTQSNDLNGVVSGDGAHVEDDVVRELVEWFGSLPACWLVRRPPARLVSSLLDLGARPERTGRWSGREMPRPVAAGRNPCDIVRVRTDADLDAWLEVAAQCGWLDADDDRQARRALYRAIPPGDGIDHWLAREHGEAVGIASSAVDGHVLELCTLAVLAASRRRGIGTALVLARLAAAEGRGVTVVVSAPSPDGGRLQRTLGFRTAPVVPDTCFYLPVR